MKASAFHLTSVEFTAANNDEKAGDQRLRSALAQKTNYTQLERRFTTLYEEVALKRAALNSCSRIRDGRRRFGTLLIIAFSRLSRSATCA